MGVGTVSTLSFKGLNFFSGSTHFAQKIGLVVQNGFHARICQFIQVNQTDSKLISYIKATYFLDFSFNCVVCV